ncbi:MAG TPA: imidazolonepropionase [Anaerolineae bacterium]|nr:imidazolonepropionase [Anaerolineae bacterium]
MQADLLVYNAAQVVTVASPEGPKRGGAMAELGIIPDGAVAIRQGRVLDVGPSDELRSQVRATQTLYAGGHVVLPGLVDPHTHLVWAGERAAEFEMRVAGATYMEIMAAGGGIMNTVRQTREASVHQLVAQTLPRVTRMLEHGTTTVEIKSGYGLTIEDEMKQLDAIERLAEATPATIVSTFLGAHAVPAEYRDRVREYVDVVVHQMIPAVARRDKRPAFCDVFCEEGAFSVAESRRVLEAARSHGMGCKIHVDEFKALGGTRLAVEMGATSADHLVCTPPDEIEMLAASDTIAVALPGTPFGLGQCDYTPARALIDAGGAVALATDCNPGTCWCENMQLMIALACRYMGMTPAEAISAATINAAHALGLGAEVGSLEPGKRADLILLDVPSYQHLGYRFGTNLVDGVIVGGQML